MTYDVAAFEELRKAAAAFYEAVTTNLGPCTGPHDGTPCYECHIAGEHARAEHETGERLANLLGIERVNDFDALANGGAR